MFAASGLMRGGGGRTAFGAGNWFVCSVGALTRVLGSVAGLLSCCCNGEGADGMCCGSCPLAFSCRIVNGLLKLAGAACGDGGAFPQIWSPIDAISISSPQLEHLMAGRKLAGLAPEAASVAAKDML